MFKYALATIGCTAILIESACAGVGALNKASATPISVTEEEASATPRPTPTATGVPLVSPTATPTPVMSSDEKDISSNSTEMDLPLERREPGTFPVGNKPIDIEFDGESIWVTNYGDDSVTKLAVDGTALGSHRVGTGPVDLEFDGRASG